MERRKFIESLPLLSFIGKDFIHSIESSLPNQWSEVKKLFPKSSQMLNLNSGSAGTMPLSVENFLIEKLKEMNRGPAYEVWGSWADSITAIKQGLADYIKVAGDRISITRNATEALNFIINGIQFETQRTDIIYAIHDYPNVIKSIEYRCQNTKANKKKLDLNLANLTDAQIIDIYKEAINEQTGLVVLTHLTHREGRILPIKEITKIAHQFGAKVLLDGAQSFGHFNFDLAELNVDYFATSLHKWFNAPLGTGFVYIKEEEDSKIAHPLYPNKNHLNNVENFGTSAYFLWAGLASSLLFNKNVLPLVEKEKRLQFLSNYWMEPLKQNPSIVFRHHPSSKTVGIHAFKILNLNIKKVKSDLIHKYNINIKMVGTSNGSYIRISPNVFTLEDELDFFLECLHKSISSHSR